MQPYPIHLDLTGRRVLVVGAGPVALRRLAGLLDAGARPEVVALSAPPDLTVPVQRRAFRPDDVLGAWLVFACTGVIDEQVAAACGEHGVWCVRADSAADSAAWVPAVLRHEDLSVSVTAGGDPRRAVAVRDAISLSLDTGALPLRRVRPREGSVALVGGGPGDPGLLTVRGRRLLAAADVVVRDRLAPSYELPAAVEVIEVGKSAHGSSWSQGDIQDLLVERAVAGQRVVRLKGGDVHLFARGIEEVAACVAAGVQVEVVPGVSSVFAVPASAGIPVTVRGVTQSVTVVSAHVAPGDERSTVDWDALASLGGTLVLLMAVERLAAVCAALVSGGLDSQTPVAVVRNGSLPHQEVVISTLARAGVEAAHLAAPAIVIVGEVVAHRVVP